MPDAALLWVLLALLALLAVWGGAKVALDWKRGRVRVKRDLDVAEAEVAAEEKRYKRMNLVQADIDEQNAKLYERMQGQIAYLEDSHRRLHKATLESQAKIEVLARENGKCEERCAKLEKDNDDCKQLTAKLVAEVTILKGGPL